MGVKIFKSTASENFAGPEADRTIKVDWERWGDGHRNIESMIYTYGPVDRGTLLVVLLVTPSHSSSHSTQQPSS